MKHWWATETCIPAYLCEFNVKFEEAGAWKKGAWPFYMTRLCKSKDSCKVCWWCNPGANSAAGRLNGGGDCLSRIVQRYLVKRIFCFFDVIYEGKSKHTTMCLVCVHGCICAFPWKRSRHLPPSLWWKETPGWCLEVVPPFWPKDTMKTNISLSCCRSTVCVAYKTLVTKRKCRFRRIEGLQLLDSDRYQFQKGLTSGNFPYTVPHPSKIDVFASPWIWAVWLGGKDLQRTAFWVSTRGRQTPAILQKMTGVQEVRVPSQ